MVEIVLLRDNQSLLTHEDENRLYDLAKKQKCFLLDVRELKEFLRLSNKKSNETASLTKPKSSTSGYN